MTVMEHIHTEAYLDALSEGTFVCPACKRFVETLKNPTGWVKATTASESKVELTP
jgi:hypothetical protein